VKELILLKNWRFNSIQELEEDVKNWEEIIDEDE
jgi:hypothetical protein